MLKLFVYYALYDIVCVDINNKRCEYKHSVFSIQQSALAQIEMNDLTKFSSSEIFMNGGIDKVFKTNMCDLRSGFLNGIRG